MGKLDMRLRSLIHRHLERPPLLLRNILPLQRRHASLRPALRLLALLALLPKSLNLLDRRSSRRYVE